MVLPLQNFTYSKLLSLVPSYMERPDAAFAAQMPTFVALAENQLATDMKTQGFLSVVKGVLPLSPLMNKPVFWRETVSFRYINSYGLSVPLFLRPLEYVQAYWPDTNQKQAPKYYADYNINNFWLGATPDVKYPFELAYMARLQPLGPQNDSNWMTLNAPQALFFGVLRQAAVWAKNATALSLYEPMYTAAVQGIVSENAERLSDRTEVVTRG